MVLYFLDPLYIYFIFLTFKSPYFILSHLFLWRILKFVAAEIVWGIRKIHLYHCKVTANYFSLMYAESAGTFRAGWFAQVMCGCNVTETVLLLALCLQQSTEPEELIEIVDKLIFNGLKLCTKIYLAHPIPPVYIKLNFGKSLCILSVNWQSIQDIHTVSGTQILFWSVNKSDWIHMT